MNHKYIPQYMGKLLELNTTTSTLHDFPTMSYQSVDEIRSTVNPTSLNWHYQLYAFNIVDASKETYLSDSTGRYTKVNPDAIIGVAVSITDTRTGAQQLVTMNIDGHTSSPDYANLRDVIEQCISYYGKTRDGELPANIEITPLVGAHNFDAMFVSQLQQELGLQGAQAEQFANVFHNKSYFYNDLPLYQRLMATAHAVLSEHHTPAKCEQIIAQAQHGMEAKIAQQSWVTQMTWQLSAIPENIAMTMREHMLGEAILFEDKGFPSEQARALALLKVANKECHDTHLYRLTHPKEFLPDVAALKERAAQMALDAGCPKDAMLEVTTSSIDAPKHTEDIYCMALREAFVAAMCQLNNMPYTSALQRAGSMEPSFAKRMGAIASDMYWMDGHHYDITPQADLQIRIAEKSYQLQYTFKEYGVQSPIVAEPASIAEMLTKAATREDVRWQEYIAQYLVEMPYETHKNFIDKVYAELQQINMLRDGENVASMATAAHHALSQMVRDESLTPGVRLHLAGLECKALDQALEAGANPNELADIDRDSHEDVGDDE